jgi:hypothetical protein
VSIPPEHAADRFAAAREVAVLRQQATVAGEQSRRSAERLIEVEQILADCMAQTVSLEELLLAQSARVEELTHRLERADLVTTEMKASSSWKVTAPMRALKRLR